MNESEKTAFTVEQNSNGTFKLHNGAWYWNMQGGVTGTRFCSYNSADDANNNVNFWYFTSASSDVINFPTFGDGNEEIASYSVTECGVDAEVYRQVSVNAEAIEGTAVSGAAGRADYDIGFESVKERPRVNYVNTVNPEALRTLTFGKKLFDADGVTPITSDTTEFNFRLYFGTESDTDPAPADMYTYHVKDENGYYCSWNPATQKFEKIGGGIADYAQLSKDQKTASGFSTSMNGAISRIPIGYNVEIRQILAGTKYSVQERPREIPDGYSFQKYVYYDHYDDPVPTAVYEGRNTVALAGAPGNDYNMIAAGKDPHVDICNLKGWGLRVKKVWTDADYMTDRDTTYFAVYTRKQNPGSEHGQGLLNLVPGTLRALPYGTSTLYWYWLRLPENDVPFTDYVIREVEIKNGTPNVNEDGEVTNENELNIKWIGDGYTVSLNGTQKGETGPAAFTYTVHYSQGEISSLSNVRVDTVTNDRPGVILKKEDRSGNALAGATFILTEENSDIPIGTFTSDHDGNITTAFLGINKNYTLTETAAPQGYHGLETNMTIRLTGGSQTDTNRSSVTVSGPDAEFYSVTQAEGNDPATLIIKNRPFILQAVKEDADTHARLSGVHFEMHKQVTVDGMTSFDNAVLTG